MGILDYPGVALSWLDGAVAGAIPETVRIVLWGVLAGIATMALYARASQQGRLADLKNQSRDARTSLANYDGDFSGAMELARSSLRIAMVRLRLSLMPAAFAGLPMLFVAVWMSSSFAYERPANGERVDIVSIRHDAANEAGDLHRSTRAATVRTGRDGRLSVVDSQGVKIASLPPGRLSDTIQPWRWWNLLIGNPAGYLPATSTVDEVTMSFSSARYVPEVPEWMAGWEFIFLLTASLASIAVKVILRLD